jgi:hypothetical protein
MIERIFELSPTDYRDLIRETARHMGVQEGIVEKDIWVSVALDCIFRSRQYAPHFVFKGGTSLSKVHNAIDRFSEDVDLIMDWRLLGYGADTIEPWDKERSATQQDKLNKELNASAARYLRDVFVPWLQDDLSHLGSVAPTVKHENNHGVQIQYSPVFQLPYVRSHVLLEIGPVASWMPNEKARVRPYVAEHFPDIVGSVDVPVVATTVERTFWEKATILHQQFHHPKGPARRYSRHYYDVYTMSMRGIADRALQRMAMLKDVAAFKQRFYYSRQARYDLAQPPTLRLVPPKEKLRALQRDYRDMGAMFFGTPPQWEDVLAGLSELETRINGADGNSTADG